MAMLTALLLQYLLGMYVNLFASLPVGIPNFSGSYPGQGVFDTHLVLGYILGIVAVVTLVFAIMTRRRPFIALGALGFVAILTAGIAGIDFSFATNFTNNDYSYTMAVAFILSLLFYSNLLMLSISALRQTNVSALPSA